MRGCGPSEPWARGPPWRRYHGCVIPCWHPQSALLFTGPPTFASAFMLRRLLGRGQSVPLLYAGDRMWPSVRHGDAIRVEPAGGAELKRGDVVVAAPGGIPDLLRVDETAPSDRVVLRGDADPVWRFEVGATEILGRAGMVSRPVAAATRVARRRWLDLMEALGGRPDDPVDGAGTVRAKYDTQATFYAHGTRDELTERVRSRLRESVPERGKILVAGSGVGTECIALAEAGYRIVGVDFAPAMVAIARDKTKEAGLSIDLVAADLRAHDEPASSLDAVLFTNAVYSFVPKADARVALLSRMARWLRPGGVVLLSARRVSGPWERVVLTAQWARSRGGEEGAWGASHTRWIAGDGRMRRSFNRIFGLRTLKAEAARAGFVMGQWEGGHALLRRARR